MKAISVDWELAGKSIRLGSLGISVSERKTKDTFFFTPTSKGLELMCQLGLNPGCGCSEMRAGALTEATTSDLLLRAILDSVPDFWGQRVLRERERESARLEGRRPRRLGIADYLPINDLRTAKGSVRFRCTAGDEAVSPEVPLPTFSELARIERGMNLIESRSLLPLNELDYLSRVSSSLGGARPKTNCTARDGSLWIAKFPSVFDEWDVEAWEMVCLELARHCGLMVPETRLVKTSSGSSTLLVKRFDRIGAVPIPFLSAKVFVDANETRSLDRSQNVQSDEQFSYLDIARFLKNQDVPANELRELWLRIVFNMTVRNTDDHIKNHGYLYSNADTKWHLSSVYDITPNPFGEFLALAVDGIETTIDFDLALSVAERFDVKATDAARTVSEVKRIVSSEWKPLARRFDIDESEIDLMSSAFA